MRSPGSVEIVAERLRAQRLTSPAGGRAGRADATVASLGAVQAQDYRGALWGVGMRTSGATEQDVEKALADRVIVRTWPMRGTLHLVASKDVRWMLRLLTPRVLARCAGRNRQLELDDTLFRRCSALLANELAGNRGLTRAEAYALFEGAGVATRGGRGLHVLMILAMQGLLCFGPRRGRQPTFVLLDEWVPESPALARDEALAELAERYFVSHGPATVHDFAWWSGQSLRDARRGIEIAGGRLTKRALGGREHWSRRPARSPSAGRGATVAHLLPPWDELTVAYRDREAFLSPRAAARTRNGIFAAVVAVDGRIAGIWKRQESRENVRVDVELFARPTSAVRAALERAVARYAAFLGVKGTLAVTAPRTSHPSAPVLV